MYNGGFSHSEYCLRWLCLYSMLEWWSCPLGEVVVFCSYESRIEDTESNWFPWHCVNLVWIILVHCDTTSFPILTCTLNMLFRYYMTCLTRKQTWWSLSLSYQKKDGRAHPSFGMTPAFQECNLWYQQNSEKSVSSQKKDGRGHPSPSFFWYDNNKDLKVCFLVTRIIYVCEN